MAIMSPEEWRADTIGQSFDIDGAYGAQCWDYFAYFVQAFGLNVSTYCALTGYVCDLWRLKDQYKYYEVFDYVNPGEPLRNGDWCFWDKGSSHNASHVAQYFNGQELGQNQGAPYVTEKATTWDIMGALRLKAWAFDIPTGASDREHNGHKYSVYRQSPAESFAVLSAGLNKLKPIKQLDADAYIMAKVTGANFFQMRTDQPDPYGTTYGDISAPLNEVWTETPNQNTTLYFDYDTGAYGDCTGIHINPEHNVASPAIVYPSAGNYQYARMIERNGDKGAAYLNTPSRYTFAVRLADGSYIVGITGDELTPRQIAEDFRNVPDMESIQFFDGGGSAQFGRWNGHAFEYVRDTGREVPSAFAIISKNKPETAPQQDETQKDEDEPMDEEKTPETPEIEPVENWDDPEPKTNIIVERIAALLSVKSLITIFLTVIFGLLVLRGAELPDKFVSIYTMCISFFFGYQFKKAENK